jgi:ribosomal-protein-alanine N-acetyltransferase
LKSDVQTPTGARIEMRFAMMQASDIEQVVSIENDAFPFPWTRGNFLDSLASGYPAWVMRAHDGRLAGYFLLMNAVDELHILNITVRPDLQGSGLGRVLLNKVVALARAENMQSVLLEVRPSNQRALDVYRHVGFVQIGVRKNYYPAGAAAREEAIVMRLLLSD